MVLFKSPHPDLQYPENLTTWQWLFEENEWSPLYNRGSQPLGAYINAVTGERLDWAQVKEKATKLSTVLIRNYGLQPGDTVSLFSTNTVWYPLAMWAIVRAGGRVNGASPAYLEEEMTHALKTAKSKILITLPSALKIALAAADNAGLPRDRVLLLEGKAEGFTNIQELIDIGTHYTPNAPWPIPKGKSSKDVCCYLNFSSGTTGFPKAVMISHLNMISQCLQLRQLQIVEPGEQYKILAVMPLFHITGLVRFCTYPILMNGFSIMLPAFTLPSMLSAIVSHKIRELILVPPILIRIVRDPVANEYDLSVVRRWSSGSAPISPEIIKALQQKFPWTGFRQGYGATESTACISCHPPSHHDYKYAATGGMLVANTTAKVISLDDGRELGVGETGEICARGPQIAMGYLDNEAATKESFDSEGYLHTGDVGHIDAEGLIHIEDRIKEMIKVKGLQVPPAELEDLLLGHPDVDDCAVVGIPDMYSGEKPKAVVVAKKSIKDKHELGVKLLAYVKEKKVRYKWLAEIEFADEVPKSPTGKLLRRVLKAREREGKSRGLKVRDAERARL
ncbi:4-coumarate-CoA ligase [Rhizodiscina lignyota]|uniref:4-coumarate-CoA ligase n=1 Tax=Rhizodiscina lignyota TaxID=1504668 RepID=A0A9P4M314_9PEZI|nr:4-coumarate-CoA ligase [Rhizodiscina lignyota]